MKQNFKNILILFLAIIVFFVGTGVTTMDLCCSDCLSNLISMQHDDSLCNEIDMDTSCSSHTDLEDTTSCEDQLEGDDCCVIERISVDIDHNYFKPVINSPLVWSNTSFGNEVFCMNPTLPLVDERTESYRTPIPIPPRDYLSLIRILII